MFKFITSRPFWVNLLAAAALGILIIFLFLQLLSWITRHGEYLTVPAVTGKKTTDATKLLESQGFDVVIQDSIYTDTLPRGTVIKQLPDPNATVKVNRSVYLTVNRVIPPMINMPDLENKGLSFALDILARNHLLLEDTIFKPNFMRGAVIEQLYRGRKITPGTKVQWGSKITLVVASGTEESNLVVPNLWGMRYSEAKPLFDSLGVMVVPVPDADVTDTLNAFIYKQNPPHLDDQQKLVFIKPGMVMDIWLSTVKKHLEDSLNTKKPSINKEP